MAAAAAAQLLRRFPAVTPGTFPARRSPSRPPAALRSSPPSCFGAPRGGLAGGEEQRSPGTAASPLHAGAPPAPRGCERDPAGGSAPSSSGAARAGPGMGDFAAPAANGSSVCINAGLGGGLAGAAAAAAAGVPKHSTVVERLRQRIEGCRRHHVSCESRYQQAQAEQLELERRDTVSLYQRTLEQRAKKTGAGGKQPPPSKQPQDAEPAAAEQRNHTLIMVRAARGARRGAAGGQTFSPAPPAGGGEGPRCRGPGPCLGTVRGRPRARGLAGRAAAGARALPKVSSGFKELGEERRGGGQGAEAESVGARLRVGSGVSHSQPAPMMNNKRRRGGSGAAGRGRAESGGRRAPSAVCVPTRPLAAPRCPGAGGRSPFAGRTMGGGGRRRRTRRRRKRRRKREAAARLPFRAPHVPPADPPSSIPGRAEPRSRRPGGGGTFLPPVPPHGPALSARSDGRGAGVAPPAADKSPALPPPPPAPRPPPGLSPGARPGPAAQGQGAAATAQSGGGGSPRAGSGEATR